MATLDTTTIELDEVVQGVVRITLDKRRLASSPEEAGELTRTLRGGVGG